jgi:hypothetical protein
MPRSTRPYDCYVVLAHVHRNDHILPTSAAHKRDEINDWHDLVTKSTLTVWLVEGTTITHARDLVLAYLAGHAPVGVTRLYSRD